MCQINIDLSNFKDFGLEDYHRLCLKSNITEIVNKLNNENTLKEYYIIFIINKINKINKMKIDIIYFKFKYKINY